MTIWTASLGLLFVTLTTSCYNPDLAGVKYSCDEVNPYCPDGLECSGGVCVKPGSTTDATPMLPSDGGMSLAGCRFSGGVDLGGGVFACPGEFYRNRAGSPTASELCAVGASICSTPRTADLAKCNSLPGFFGSTQPIRYNGSGNRDDAKNYSCQSTGNPFDRAVSGCGRLTSGQVADKNCGGFTRVLHCGAVQSWTCNNDVLDNSHENSNPQDGVLCCLP